MHNRTNWWNFRPIHAFSKISQTTEITRIFHEATIIIDIRKHSKDILKGCRHTSTARIQTGATRGKFFTKQPHRSERLPRFFILFICPGGSQKRALRFNIDEIFDNVQNSRCEIQNIAVLGLWKIRELIAAARFKLQIASNREIQAIRWGTQLSTSVRHFGCPRN